MKITNSISGLDFYQNQYQQSQKNINTSNFTPDMVEISSSSDSNFSGRHIAIRPAEMPTPRDPNQDRDEGFTTPNTGNIDVVA